jgi:hypothetical protein
VTELARTFRTITLDKIASTTRKVAVGFGQVVQVIDGAEQGVRIDWKDPTESRFADEFGIRADLNGVSSVALAEHAWVTFPASALSGGVIILRTYTAGPGPSAPWQQGLAGVREERIVQYTTPGVTIAAFAASDLSAFRSVDTFISPDLEKIHRRRFSRCQVWMEVNGTGSSIANWVLNLRLRGTPTGTSIEGRSWTWRSHGQSINLNLGSMYVEFALPLTAWKLRATNPGSGSVTIESMIMETT